MLVEPKGFESNSGQLGVVVDDEDEDDGAMGVVVLDDDDENRGPA